MASNQREDSRLTRQRALFEQTLDLSGPAAREALMRKARRHETREADFVVDFLAVFLSLWQPSRTFQ